MVRKRTINKNLSDLHRLRGNNATPEIKGLFIHINIMPVQIKKMNKINGTDIKGIPNESAQCG